MDSAQRHRGRLTDLLVVAYLIALGCILGTSYQILSALGLPTYVAALLIHIFFGISGLLVMNRMGLDRPLFSIQDFRLCTLAALPLIGSLGLVVISSVVFPPRETTEVNHAQLVYVFVIPLVEELFFRGLIGNYLRSRLGNWSGAYLSALFFAWMHSIPSFEVVLAGKSGIILGPLLLGLLCETFMIFGRRSLVPCIILHMVCNATVPLFALTDARWLKWLEPLYH